MEFVSLSLAQQALINLLCLCIGEDKEHALRVLKSALYIAEREG